MKKFAFAAVATVACLAQSGAFGATGVLVTTKPNVGTTVTAQMINQGGESDTDCEVVSVGQYYCTIDGKGYYCTTGDNPDKDKDCYPAIVKHNPVRPIAPISPIGVIALK